MDSKKCQFCEHGNPAGSKYCSECGGCLYLLPCPHCGAVTDVTAATCYQCHGHLQAETAHVLDSPPATTEVAKPDADARYFPSPLNVRDKMEMTQFDALAAGLPVTDAASPRPAPRVQPRVAACIALLAVIAAVGYYSYRQRFVVNAIKPPASSGVIRGDTPAAGMTLANTGNTVRPDDASTTRTGFAPASATLPAAGEVKSHDKTAPSLDAKSVPAPAAGKLATDGGSARERGASAVAACAPAIAALGLCAATPVHAKEADADAVLKAANARPPGAGKADPAEHQAVCADGVTSFGLCAPTMAVPAVTHTQRNE
jgi:hypothetical protein